MVFGAKILGESGSYYIVVDNVDMNVSFSIIFEVCSIFLILPYVDFSLEVFSRRLTWA